jgi:hypothetical protein
MRLDAWEAQQAQYQKQQPVVRDGIWREHIPGYDPDEDHWAEFFNKPMYFEDLRTASRGWWRAKKGADGPPAPEYRYTDGGMQLGRYVDAYAAQARMRWAKSKWNRALIAGGIVLASSMVFGLIGGFLGLVLGGIVFLVVRRRYKRQYSQYYAVQAEVLRTHQPVWVAYDSSQLQKIRRDGFYLWP